MRNLKRRKKKKEDSTVNGRFRDSVNGGKRTRRRSGVRFTDLGKEEARGEEAAAASAAGVGGRTAARSLVRKEARGRRRKQ